MSLYTYTREGVKNGCSEDYVMAWFLSRYEAILSTVAERVLGP